MKLIDVQRLSLLKIIRLLWPHYNDRYRRKLSKAEMRRPLPTGASTDSAKPLHRTHHSLNHLAGWFWNARIASRAQSRTISTLVSFLTFQIRNFSQKIFEQSRALDCPTWTPTQNNIDTTHATLQRCSSNGPNRSREPFSQPSPRL